MSREVRRAWTSLEELWRIVTYMILVSRVSFLPGEINGIGTGTISGKGLTEQLQMEVGEICVL